MATIPLPSDFSEFLKLLNAHEVKYLLVGGYAVGYYGYIRATADMDIWIESSAENADRMVDVVNDFGFGDPELNRALFLNPDKIVRFGIPPMRIEIMTVIDGVDFVKCYENREIGVWDDVEVSLISLADLKKNKKASGRLKDLSDLDYLP